MRPILAIVAVLLYSLAAQSGSMAVATMPVAVMLAIALSLHEDA